MGKLIVEIKGNSLLKNKYDSMKIKINYLQYQFRELVLGICYHDIPQSRREDVPLIEEILMKNHGCMYNSSS